MFVAFEYFLLFTMARFWKPFSVESFTMMNVCGSENCQEQIQSCLAQISMQNAPTRRVSILTSVLVLLLQITFEHESWTLS